GISAPAVETLRVRLLTAAALLVLAGCGSSAALPYMRSDTALRLLSQSGAGKITHIVFIVQENRSFDNLFQGYPGADTVAYGKDSSGRRIKLEPASLAAFYVIDHSAGSMFAACDGTGKLPGTDCRMDGFDKEYASGYPASLKHPQYVYVPHKES